MSAYLAAGDAYPPAGFVSREISSRGALLSVDRLNLEITSAADPVRVVRDVSLNVRRGEVLALVGESGCGKTLTSLAMIGLLPAAVRVSSGSIVFDGAEIVGAPDERLRLLRGGRIGFVFQDPMTALNPVITVGNQLAQPLRLEGHSKKSARVVSQELLELVEIPNARSRLNSYPHEFSGGMRQRVLIAMALSRKPDLLIADEPTTALDVTVQAEVLNVLKEIQRQLHMAVILVSHDLGVVSGFADQVVVMYAGYVVEAGTTARIFEEPAHPYTSGLLGCIPRVRERGARLASIDGAVPDPAAMPPGCPFWPRCPIRGDARCQTDVPPLAEIAADHFVRTFYSAGATD